MDWLTAKLRTRTVLIASAIGSVLNVVALRIEPYPHAKGTSETIWSLQFAGNSERFAEVLEAWVSVNGVEAIDNAAKTLVRLDYTFPVLYGVFFASALAFLWTSPHRRSWSRWLVLLPLVAGLCDMTENTLHLILLADIPPIDVAAIDDGMVVWATRFAVAKYSLLAIAVLLIPAGATRRRLSRGAPPG